MVQIVHATLQRESNCWLLFVGSTDSTLARNIIRGPSLNLLIKDVLPKKSLRDLGPVWYMCLKTENCCLKTFVEIRVGEKVY